MTDTTREAVERLLDGVTDGPWSVSPSRAGRAIVCAKGRTIGAAHLRGLEGGGIGASDANARFIAAARELVPALLARAEAAEARADAAEATVAEVTSDRAYIIGANAGWEAAVEQGEATPEAKSAMVRFWRRIAEQHLSHADAAEAALAAERETVARLTEALQRVIALDDTAECCGQGICGGYSPPECCGQPLYGFDRAQNIARAALLTEKPHDR